MVVRDIAIMNRVPRTNPREAIVTGIDKIPAPIMVLAICVEAVPTLEEPSW